MSEYVQYKFEQYNEQLLASNPDFFLIPWTCVMKKNQFLKKKKKKKKNRICSKCVNKLIQVFREYFMSVFHICIYIFH